MVPQISVIMAVRRGAVYSPALTDFIFMVNRTGNMFITGPQVIKAVTGESVTAEAGRGRSPQPHQQGGPLLLQGRRGCFDQIRTLLSFLPANNIDDPPLAESREPALDQAELAGIVPTDPNKSFDVREVIRRITDGSELFEVHQGYATNAVVGFARLGGRR